MIKHSNLTRGLLISTIVWTLSSNYALKVSAQVIDDLSSSRKKQEQTITNDQDILYQVEILQQQAEKFRKTVDLFNLQLQEQLNSQRTSNIVDVQPVLVNWEELNLVWHNLTNNLEKHPEFSNLLQEDQVFHNIEQNLIFQKEIISNLAKILNNSSTLIITELQEQLFTRRELSRNSYPYGTFEVKTQHKFALISTNKARELEVQVSQIENILSSNLLHREQTNNTNYKTESTITSNQNSTKELNNSLSEQNEFLKFNTLIALILLSSCAIFIILRNSNHNQDILQNKDLEQEGNSEIFRNNLVNYDVTDYLKNVQKIEHQARKLLNSTNQIIEHQKNSIEQDEKFQVKNYSVASSSNKIKPNYNNFSDSSATQRLSITTPTQVIQEFSPTFTSLATEEDLILMYRKNRQLLYQKSITVEITKKSKQRIQTKPKYDIFFEETSNGGYWIVFEPKLENNCYFLVPNPFLDITSLTSQNIDNIFTCTRYNNRTSDQFSLKYSAMVQVHNSSSWRLIGNGEITFS
ncbi:MAG: hypothetical protein AB4372_02355 [Xenococcus sp. (in: cyanobacteria)]